MFAPPIPQPLQLSSGEHEFFDDVFSKIWNAYMHKYDSIVSNLNAQKVILRKFYFEVKSKSYISEYDKLAPEQFLNELYADVLRSLTFKELGKKYYLQLGESLAAADAPVFVFLHVFRSFGEAFFQDNEGLIRKIIVLMLANTHDLREIEDVFHVNRRYMQDFVLKHVINPEKKLLCVEFNPLYQKRLEVVYQDASKYTSEQFNLLYPELFMGYKLVKRLLDERRFKDDLPVEEIPENSKYRSQRRYSPRYVSVQPPPPKPQPQPSRKYSPARRSASPSPVQPPRPPPPVPQSRKRSRSPDSHSSLETASKRPRASYDSTSTFERPPKRSFDASITSQTFKKSSKQDDGPPIYKLQMCKYVKSGEGCRKGASCTYAHTEAELQEGQDAYYAWKREHSNRPPRKDFKQNDTETKDTSPKDKNYSPSPKQQENGSRDNSPRNN